MAWSVLTWKILRIFQSQFLSGKVCAETRHSSYTNTLPTIMKKILLTSILGIIITSCGVKKTLSSKTELDSGWYFITEQETESKLVQNRFTGEDIFINNNPIIKASESSTIAIENQNWGGQDYIIIQLIFEGDAKEKWANATERMSRTNEKAAFIYKDQVISTVYAFLRMDNGYAAVSNKNFTKELLNKIVADLKREK